MKSHAIGLVAGCETVFEAVAPCAHIQGRWKSLCIQPGTTNHHIVQRPAQRCLLSRARLAIPRIQRAAAGNVFRQLFLEESHQIILMANQPFTSLLRFDAQGILEHALIGTHEIRTGVDVATSQCLTQENRVRQRRILQLERHRPFLYQHQPEQADLLVGHHATTLLRPVRIATARA